MNNTEFNGYLEQVPESIKKDVINICRIPDNEQRWRTLKHCFLAYAPELVDNKLAWNIYQTTI
jgi:hypothetical protein